MVCVHLSILCSELINTASTNSSEYFTKHTHVNTVAHTTFVVATNCVVVCYIMVESDFGGING